MQKLSKFSQDVVRDLSEGHAERLANRTGDPAAFALVKSLKEGRVSSFDVAKAKTLLSHVSEQKDRVWSEQKGRAFSSGPGSIDAQKLLSMTYDNQSAALQLLSGIKELKVSQPFSDTVRKTLEDLFAKAGGHEPATL